MSHCFSTAPNLQLVYVSDVQRSTDFYKKIFGADPVFSSTRYVAFKSGDASLYDIWCGGDNPDLSVPRYSEIGIMVPTNKDVETLCSQWKKDQQITFLKDIHTEVFGMTFLIKDPDGHIIRVCPLD